MTSQELNQALWNAANVMRSTMSADEYKNYLQGLTWEDERGYEIDRVTDIRQLHL